MTTNNKNFSVEFKLERIKHWNQVAINSDQWKSCGSYYHHYLEKIYGYLIPESKSILEIGCGTGDLLASLNPSYGVGIDFSPEMVKRAKKKHPNLEILEMDALDLSINEKFDYIILSDLLNDIWDVQSLFEQIKSLCSPKTRIIINSYSHLWELPLKITNALGLSKARLQQNWLTKEDIENLLEITNFDVIRSTSEILFPLNIPLLSHIANRYLAKIFPFSLFALTNIIIVKDLINEPATYKEESVSVIVPARNEAGNIQNIIDQIPEMGSTTEIIFVEGGSKDNTYETIQAAIKNNPDLNLSLYKQSGKGKGDAVRLGFNKANGDILMILDADLTVPAEDLPRFYKVINSGKAEFVNGVRLVYPMQKRAMRFLNLIGNKFFSIAFSWLLGQPIKDTLCGTKVIHKYDYEQISKNREYFGDFDPFGDFDLIFGAAKLNLKIVDLPIRYRERIYGDTNISRWKHGLLLLRMVIFAAKKIKFFG